MSPHCSLSTMSLQRFISLYLSAMLHLLHAPCRCCAWQQELVFHESPSIQQALRPFPHPPHPPWQIPVVKIDGPQSPEWINGSTLYSDLFPHAPTLQEGMIGFRNDSPHRYQPGMGFGRRNKLEAINRICGTGDEYTFLQLTHRLGLLQLFYPDFTPQLADTGECGCQRETGSEAKTRPMRMSVLHSCGLSIRLWYYPCPEVDGARIMRDGWYRFKQRQKARFILLDRIRERIKQFTAEQSG
ncbi:unnamed protein product [Closterium sp. NIES-53]